MEKLPIYLFGYPRSGNVWLARLLGDALNSPVMADPEKKLTQSIGDEGFEREGAFVIHQHHAWRPLREDAPIIYLYRDPRDVAVSIMYYWKLETLDNVFSHDGKAPKILHPTYGWVSMVNEWVNFYDDYVTIFIHYEMLLENPFNGLISIISSVVPPELMPSDGQVEKAIGQQSFQSRRSEVKSADPNKYPYGQTIQLEHMRKGIRGDWKNHFKRRHAEIAHGAWWKWLLYCGYESNEDWWKEVEE